MVQVIKKVDGPQNRISMFYEYDYRENWMTRRQQLKIYVIKFEEK